MIGIIGAMRVEVEEIIKLMTDIKIESTSHITYTIGKLANQSCVVAQCAPGKVNSAICTQTMIIKYNPSFIINIGVAGGLAHNIKIGDIVVATDVIQHDVDTSALGDAKGMISGINLINIPCSESLNKKLLNAIERCGYSNFHLGTILTGDQFISDNVTLQTLMDTFNGIACEMEGGSIGQTCYINNVDFVVLRIISDKANDGSHFDYNTFVHTVAKKSAKIIKTFFLS